MLNIYKKINQSNCLDKPLGLWVIFIGDVLITIPMLISLCQMYLSGPNDYWASEGVEHARFFVPLILLIFVALIGTWRGYKYFSTALLFLFSILAVVMITINVNTINYAFSSSAKQRQDWTLLTWWGLSSGLRWMLWLGFHYWYLLKIYRKT